MALCLPKGCERDGSEKVGASTTGRKLPTSRTKFDAPRWMDDNLCFGRGRRGVASSALTREEGRRARAVVDNGWEGREESGWSIGPTEPSIPMGLVAGLASRNDRGRHLGSGMRC